MRGLDKEDVNGIINTFCDDQERWDMSLKGSHAVQQLEKRFVQLTGHKFALAVSNATMGLWAVLSALEFRNSDFISTPLTWGGSIAGAIALGNRPFFADIESTSLCLDPDTIINALTPNTEVIIAVDYSGNPCDGKSLREVADEYGLFLLADCAQSFGAYLDFRHAGYWADAAVFSLTFDKPLYAGEGGVIVTSDEQLYERLVWQTQHVTRQLRDTPHLAPNELFLNLRINPLTAAFANHLFDGALEQVEKHRGRCLAVLQSLMHKNMVKTILRDDNLIEPSFHYLTFEPVCTASEIQTFLSQNNLPYQVTAAPIITPLYQHEVFKRLAINNGWSGRYDCPEAENQSQKRIRLHPCPVLDST